MNSFFLFAGRVGKKNGILALLQLRRVKPDDVIAGGEKHRHVLSGCAAPYRLDHLNCGNLPFRVMLTGSGRLPALRRARRALQRLNG